MRRICKYFGDGVDEVIEQYDLDLDLEIETRQVMNFIATEWGRNIDPCIWVKCAVHEIKREMKFMDCFSQQVQDSALFVIDDFRFANEHAFITQHFDNVHTIRLDCPEDARRTRAKYWGEPEHQSEVNLDSFDFDLVIDTTRPSDEVDLAVRDFLKAQRAY